MIKPANITRLNTSNTLEYECEKCGAKGTFKLENSIINVDNDGKPLGSMDDYECPECGKKI